MEIEKAANVILIFTRKKGKWKKQITFTDWYTGYDYRKSNIKEWLIQELEKQERVMGKILVNTEISAEQKTEQVSLGAKVTSGILKGSVLETLLVETEYNICTIFVS